MCGLLTFASRLVMQEMRYRCSLVLAAASECNSPIVFIFTSRTYLICATWSAHHSVVSLRLRHAHVVLCLHCTLTRTLRSANVDASFPNIGFQNDPLIDSRADEFGSARTSSQVVHACSSVAYEPAIERYWMQTMRCLGFESRDPAVKFTGVYSQSHIGPVPACLE